MGLRRDMVEQLQELLPADLRSKAMVAGGYAADPSRANDIDLWVVGMADLPGTERYIRKYLGEVGWLSSDRADSLASEEYQDSGDFRVVAMHHVYEPIAVSEDYPSGLGSKTWTVQILISNQPTFLHLLNRFDLSVHQIGYSLDAPNVAILAPTFTTIHEQPRVVNFERPNQTFRRVERIFPRYGFEPLEKDIQLLVAAQQEVLRLQGFRNPKPLSLFEEAA